MNKTIKLALFLGIVAAISGLVLGIVNYITEPVINQNAVKAEQKNLELMYPNAEFKILDYKDDDGIIIGAYKANDTNYIFKGTAVGYNSSTPIVVLVGLNKDGAIENMVALEQQETNGFGARCFEKENIANLYLNKKSVDEIDMLSGATFTSTALKTIMGEVFEAYEAVK